jgi:3-oxoacyl-[acyl-carrier protein] reductase
MDTKIGLVTGGGSGIGKSAALALAAAGYDVVVNYSRNTAAAEETAREIEALGRTALVVKADVAEEAEVAAMLAQTRETFGKLDVLVNNAGTTSTIAPTDLDGMTVEEWDRVFAVNVRGMFLVTRAAVPLLRLGTAPCIVNTCSIVGLRPGPQPLPYACSKAATIALTKTLAGALGPEIRVNGVAPGWMEGDWMQRTLGENYDRLMERRAKATPLKRCVTADDVADTIMTLVTANRFVTGEIIVIDGGFTSVT